MLPRREDSVAVADEGGGVHAGRHLRHRREVRCQEARARGYGLRRPHTEGTGAPEEPRGRPPHAPGAFPPCARRRVPGHQRAPGGVRGHPCGEAPQHHGRRRRLPVHLHVARRQDREHHGVPEPLGGMPHRQAREELQVAAGDPRRREHRHEGLARAVRQDAPPGKDRRALPARGRQGVRRTRPGARDRQAHQRRALARLQVFRHGRPLQEPLPVDRHPDGRREDEHPVQDNVRRRRVRADPHQGRPC